MYILSIYKILLSLIHYFLQFFVIRYLEKLIEMELSLQLLETVNKVITTSELPKEFLTLFITNCIQHCE